MTTEPQGAVTMTRAALYKQVWAKPAVHLAKELGISDVAIGKICKKYEIPKPPLGYWAKVAHDHKVKRAPLVKNEVLDAQMIRIEPSPPAEKRTPQPKELLAKIASEKREDNHVVVRNALESPHELVARTEKSLRTATPDDFGLVRPKAKRCLDVIVGPASIDRAMRILDAFLKAAEARGITSHIEDREQAERFTNAAQPYRLDRTTTVCVDGEELVLRLTESLGERERPLTAAQKAENAKYQFLKPHPTREKYPRGLLTISAGGRSGYDRKRWSESEGRPLELRLNQVLAGLFQEAERKKEQQRKWDRQRAEQAEYEQRRIIADQIRQEEEKRRREEEQRFKALEDEALAWRRSTLIKDYVAAVQESAALKHGEIAPSSELGRWIVWANAKAKGLNPI